jgi:hypothetical protein
MAQSSADRRLLCEAAVRLAFVRIGLYAVGFAVLRRWLGLRQPAADTTQPSDSASGPAEVAGRVAWAVQAAARRIPGATCLVQALVAEAMLRRRGYEPALHFGVRQRPDRRSIDAHAWIELNGAVVVGAVANLGDYAVLSGPEHP